MHTRVVLTFRGSVFFTCQTIKPAPRSFAINAGCCGLAIAHAPTHEDQDYLRGGTTNENHEERNSNRPWLERSGICLRAGLGQPTRNRIQCRCHGGAGLTTRRRWRGWSVDVATITLSRSNFSRANRGRSGDTATTSTGSADFTQLRQRIFRTRAKRNIRPQAPRSWLARKRIGLRF